MKRILPAFAFVFFLPAWCMAQHFNAGIRLGVNASQIDGDHMGGFNHGGIVGGVFVNYDFTPRWEGQFEMLYSQKGSTRIISPDYVQSGIWDQLDLNYIEVPVMANYRFGKKIKLSGGLGGAFLISSYYDGGANAIYHDISFVRKGELSGTLGAQYYFSPKFSVYIRYSYSLLGIDKGGNWIAFYLYDGGLANNVASFGLYYSFMKNDR